VVRRVCEFAFGALLLGALSAFSACRHKPKQRALVPAGSLAHTPRLAPLRAESWLIELEVPGFGQAALAVPLGATEPRPIVIALHGAADRPEWACGAWRGIAGPAPFVLCPRGLPRADFTAPDLRYTFGTAPATASELRAGLTALKSKFGSYVAPGSVVFAGFEIGADRAAEIAQQEPTFFARLALVNAASTTWPSSLSALFGREGGERVLFACGAAGRAAADSKAVLTRRSGADARAIFLGNGPPALGPDSVSELKAVWPWLSAPVTRLAPPENLVGNPLTARRPAAPPASSR
jgi:hypothetical protein